MSADAAGSADHPWPTQPSDSGPDGVQPDDTAQADGLGADVGAPQQVSRADIPAWVGLVESAYRGEASRAGWTTEADLLGGQRLDPELAAETLAEPGTVVFLVRARGGGPDRSPAAGAAGAAPDGPARVGETGAASAGGAPLATVQLVCRDDESAYLGMFAVAPSMQGSGLGSRLMRWAEEWVVATWGVQRIRMSVIRQRAELIAYYERRGYLRTGELEPFPYGDERFGQPKREDLEFAILEKQLG